MHVGVFPPQLYYYIELGLSSPCMWGCFSPLGLKAYTYVVFPMHVGVFLFSDYARVKR